MAAELEITNVYKARRAPGLVADQVSIKYEPFLSAIESKKHQGASGPSPHLTKET